MQLRHARRNRRGAALVETAVVLSVFLGLVFGMLDLGLAVFRRHIICEAARQGARIAAVHGYLAPTNGYAMNAWGPIPQDASSNNGALAQFLYTNATGTPYPSYSVQADNSSDDLANSIRPYLPGLDPSTVTINIQWLDGNNDLGNRVMVTVSTNYNIFISLGTVISLLTRTNSTQGNNSTPLSASSTMTIAH
jgi:Flp pilus assembly protein TadG